MVLVLQKKKWTENVAECGALHLWQEADFVVVLFFSLL